MGIEGSIQSMARGWAQLDAGRQDEARDLAQRAGAELCANPQVNSAPGAVVLYWISRLLEAAGDVAAAKQVRASRLRLAEDGHDGLVQRRRVESAVVLAFESTLRPAHLELGRSRHQLAVTCSHLGLLHSARRLQEQVLEVFEQTLGTADPDDPHLQHARVNLASTLRSLGHLHRARELQEQVREVRERTLPEDHPDRLRVCGGLAATLFLLGDLRRAHQMQAHVLELLERKVRDGVLTSDDHGLQSARHNLAVSLRVLGEWRSACDLQEQVLEARSRTLPPHHGDLLRAKHSLAVTLGLLGEWGRVRELQEDVLKTRKHRLSPEDPELQSARNNLASTLRRLGHVQQARVLVEQALEVLERTLPTDHRDLQRVRTNHALILLDLDEVSRAATVMKGICRGVRARLLVLAQTSGYHVVEQLRAEIGYAVANLLSLPGNRPEAEVDLLGLQRVAIALHRARVHHLRQLEAADPLVREALSRAGIANWSLHRLLEKGHTDEELQTARSELMQADQALSRLAADRGMVGLPQVWPEDAVTKLQLALPPAVTLVLTAHYVRRDFKARQGAPHVAVYLLRSDTIQRLDLGPAKPIAEAAEDFRLRLENRGAEGRSNDRPPDSAGSARALGELLSPLVAALPPGTEQIWLCPDGALASVPWELIEDEAGELGGRFRFTYLTDLGQAIPREATPLSAPSLLCFGGIDFGAASGPEQAAEDRSPHRGMARSGDQRWPPLEASGREAEAVCEQFEKQHGKRAVLHRTGSEATRACFVNACNGQRFVHLATHAGYGLAEEWAMGEPKADELLLRSDRGGGIDRDLLSWIVFAGANSEDRGVRAGSLLTASEITSLDLTGCELVVASACDTNVGGRYFGEGVAGLNRSLHFAGARYTISSLWKVDDRGAKAFFEAFYRRLWGGTDCGVEAAFRHARETLRKKREWSSVWAAFVLYGPPMR